jgi:condensin complex subunit 1
MLPARPRHGVLCFLSFKKLMIQPCGTVISHLSVGEHAMDEEGFQRTMRYIFTFIEKEKQAESIVEKLCQRFRLTEDERQWRDIAFCLSLLPFKSDRSVKKLIEGLPFYRDKLHEETVFNGFQDILVKVRVLNPLLIPPPNKTHTSHYYYYKTS